PEHRGRRDPHRRGRLTAPRPERRRGPRTSRSGALVAPPPPRTPHLVPPAGAGGGTGEPPGPGGPGGSGARPVTRADGQLSGCARGRRPRGPPPRACPRPACRW
ncbi:hypothetical protein FHN55_01100, partial [Streptomyces sp. NP160]